MQAARRRAVTELLFFASVGDLRRCQRIVRLWNLKVRRRPLFYGQRPWIAMYFSSVEYCCGASVTT